MKLTGFLSFIFYLILGLPLAIATATILFFIGIPQSWQKAREKKSDLKAIEESIISAYQDTEERDSIDSKDADWAILYPHKGGNC